MDSSFVAMHNVFDKIWNHKNGPHLSISQSPIEEKMLGALQRLGVEAITQFPIGPYFADIFIDDGKIVVECDGKEFHKDKERDKKRDLYMTKLGYNVLRFSGFEIVHSLMDCALFVVGCIQDAERKYPRYKQLLETQNEPVEEAFCNHCGLPETENCQCGLYYDSKTF